MSIGTLLTAINLDLDSMLDIQPIKLPTWLSEKTGEYDRWAEEAKLDEWEKEDEKRI